MTATAYSVYGAIYSQGATYGISIAQGDDVPGSIPAAYGLADPLIFKQALATDDHGILAHPLPDELSFSLIAPDSSTYAALALGDEVVLAVYSGAGFTGPSTNVYFGGRVATLSASPHDLGVLYTVGCVSYLADLAERAVGLVAYPAETGRLRLRRIMDEAGLPWLGEAGPAIFIGTAGLTLAPRSAGQTDALSLILETLENMPSNGDYDENGGGPATAHGVDIHTTQYRPILRYQSASYGGPTPQLDRNQPFGYVWGNTSPFYTKRVVNGLPARLANVSGVYRVTVVTANSTPSSGNVVVDAGNVDFDTTFTQAKGPAMANRTVASGPGGVFEWDWLNSQQTTSWALPPGATYPTGLGLEGAVVLQSITTQEDVSVPSSGQRAVQAYRVPFRPDTKASWSPDTMTWNVWNVAGWVLPNLTDLFTVCRVLTSKLPGQREWVTGMVTATALTIQGGRPTIAITTMPNVANYTMHAWINGPSNGVIRFDSPALTGVLFSQLSTRDSFADYQLVRGS